MKAINHGKRHLRDVPRALSRFTTAQHNNVVCLSFVIGAVFFVLVLLPSTHLNHAQAPKSVSLESFNFPGRYIRHRDSLGYVEKIPDKLAQQDATFKLVPGLAGKCRSFESINYPDHFLRHENFRLKLAQRSNDRLFLQDATFCFVPGLANQLWYSFESLNFAGHYIRHKGADLWLDRNDGSKLFKEDATFRTASPGGGLKIDRR